MLASMMPQRGSARVPRARALLWPLGALLFFYFLVSGLHSHASSRQHSASELVQKHIDRGAGTGGRWYIPPRWLQEVKTLHNTTLISDTRPQNVVAAAQLALELSLLTSSFARHSRIPLIAHQTWRSLKTSAWPETVQNSVDGWLYAATQTEAQDADMAYIMWDDDGIEMLMKNYEPYLFDLFENLPYPVEKADTFRVAVIRWFGGFYADVDVQLLQHPNEWIKNSELDRWTDADTGKSFAPNTSPYHQSSTPDAHGSSRYQVPITSPSPYQEVMNRFAPAASETDDAVGAIMGLECDTLPQDDTYWRAGYTYPVQLTNWALASAPLHPAASAFLTQLTSDIRTNISSLASIDPLDLTGPPALTKAVKSYTEGIENPGFRWEGITGTHDPEGGRGKVVAGDLLVLPITGFSPGRGWFHNMGSMPLTHENARLAHMAQGSWRKLNVKVKAGKLCRTVLGRCRDWKKIP